MEETIGYEALLSAEEWDSLELGEGTERKTSLPEGDALRLALALNDYELVSVIDIGGSNCFGFWIRFRDERFDSDHEICSRADYWEFVTAFVRSLRAANSGGQEPKGKSQDKGSYFAAGHMWPTRPLPKDHKVAITVVDDGYELACGACDFCDHVSDVTEADNLKRLHEAFIATLVARYEVA